MVQTLSLSSSRVASGIQCVKGSSSDPRDVFILVREPAIAVANNFPKKLKVTDKPYRVLDDPVTLSLNSSM
jgi:hypothetical protein